MGMTQIYQNVKCIRKGYELSSKDNDKGKEKEKRKGKKEMQNKKDAFRSAEYCTSAKYTNTAQRIVNIIHSKYLARRILWKLLSFKFSTIIYLLG